MPHAQRRAVAAWAVKRNDKRDQLISRPKPCVHPHRASFDQQTHMADMSVQVHVRRRLHRGLDVRELERGALGVGPQLRGLGHQLLHRRIALVALFHRLVRLGRLLPDVFRNRARVRAIERALILHTHMS